jgi:CO dehydrogenase maturation factor
MSDVAGSRMASSSSTPSRRCGRSALSQRTLFAPASSSLAVSLPGGGSVSSVIRNHTLIIARSSKDFLSRTLACDRVGANAKPNSSAELLFSGAVKRILVLSIFVWKHGVIIYYYGTGVLRWGVQQTTGNRALIMKLAVSGKGGAGKTTISALIAAVLSADGHRVTAIDADPDANLLSCMGFPEPGSVRPLVELKDLIEDRTGVKPGATGGMFRLNPLVEDIPEKYAVDVDGVKVLVAGAVKKGGTGCYCPENSLVRALVSHLLMDEGSDLILDMEAGVEHLSRGTVGAVDHLLVVVEPGLRSVETAIRIEQMAGEIGIKRVSAVGNRIRSAKDEAQLRKALTTIEFVGFVPYDEDLRKAEIDGVSPAKRSSLAYDAVKKIVRELQSTMGNVENAGG